MAERERVAVLGLGIMGAPMAANLVAAGFPVAVWNRTQERAERFVAEHGAAELAASPAEAAGQSSVVITMVPDAPQVDEVLFGPTGAAAALKPGSLVIDMSTIPPTESVRIAERLRAQEVSFLDAPVTGSRPKAEDGTLTIMAGGAAEDFERARPLFEAMGKLVVHVGPQSHGSTVKLLNNTVAAVNALALAEALTAARTAGLDTARLLEVMAAGSGGSAMLDLKAGPMLEHDFEALFKLAHMLKDVRHCLAEAERLGASMELARTAADAYSRADRKGLGEQDFAAVVTVVEDDSRRE
jgi:3-hydroxyisobutyrate dehydrogenase